MQKLSQQLEEFITVANPEGLTFGELMDAIRLSGFGLLFVILSLPSALPIPAPGYSTPFAVVIILLALQIIAGRSSPIIPQRLHSRKISAKTIARIEKRGIPFLRLVERFSKPRFEILSQGRTFGLLLGIVILIVAIVMAIPIPFTNTAFAGAILLTGIGLANNDGLFVLGGGLVGLVAVAAVIALLIVGVLAFF